MWQIGHLVVGIRRNDELVKRIKDMFEIVSLLFKLVVAYQGLWGESSWSRFYRTDIIVVRRRNI